MSNKSTITCPNCKTEFEATDAFRDEVQRELNTKAKEWQLKREEEFKKKEDAFQNQLNEELTKQKASVEETIKKSISNDYENKLKMLTETNVQNEEKLKAARDKELEFLKKEQELKTKEAELEINLQKKLNDERSTISDTIRKQEEEKNAFKIKELEKQVADSKKLAEEMQRRAEQKNSQQSQGETQELVLEDLLKNSFPFDTIEEVAKGKRGADCIQVIRNNLGAICGKIIYESKNTLTWGADWIDKLKADARANQGDIAIIVTKVMPKDMEGFGQKDGVWICSLSEVKPLAHILRESIVKIFNATKSQDNKGDKMTLLYNYLLSNEFSEQWQAIREGFMSMKISISKERDAMEKLWKAREKQLEKVLLNAAHVKGSIEGIAGQESVDLNLLGNGTEE